MHRSTQLLVAVLLVFGFGCAATVAPTPDLPQHQKQEQLAPVMPPVEPSSATKINYDFRELGITWVLQGLKIGQDVQMVKPNGEKINAMVVPTSSGETIYEVPDDAMLIPGSGFVLMSKFLVDGTPVTDIAFSVEDFSREGIESFECYTIQVKEDGWFRVDFRNLPPPDKKLKDRLSRIYE